MTLKQFRSKGGSTKWSKMTVEEKTKHIEKMTAKSLETRARNKAKLDLSTAE